MPPRHTLTAAAVTAALAAGSISVDALEASVVQLRVSGARLWALVELRELFDGPFLKLVLEGRAVFLQLRAELWEDRRVFDRTVTSPPPWTYRIDRGAAEHSVVVVDQYGEPSTMDVRGPVALRVDLGPADRIDDAGRYYVHLAATAATVDDRDIDSAGAAIFGQETSERGLAALGRFVFRTLLRMGRYLESASAETTSRRVSGRDIRAGVF